MVAVWKLGIGNVNTSNTFVYTIFQNVKLEGDDEGMFTLCFAYDNNQMRNFVFGEKEMTGVRK
jgi:hypothetical protein